MEITKEKLAEINAEIQVVLTKYGVTLQPTMGISIVPLQKEVIVPEVIKENETPTEA